jgi:hypothetical protein
MPIVESEAGATSRAFDRYNPLLHQFREWIEVEVYGADPGTGTQALRNCRRGTT